MQYSGGDGDRRWEMGDGREEMGNKTSVDCWRGAAAEERDEGDGESGNARCGICETWEMQDGGNARLLTRLRITSICPPASMMAFSPRSCTTLPSTRTMRCWNCERCGCRTRGVWGWSIA